MKKLIGIIAIAVCLVVSGFAMEMADDEKEAMFIANSLEASRILLENEVM